MVCGKLHLIDSYKAANTSMAYKYETNESTGASINIPLTNPGNCNCHVAYNHKEKKLYSWDFTRLQTYDVNF